MKLKFKGPSFRFLEKNAFVIVDAGARGGPKKEWRALEPFLKCIGFEPDPEEFNRLNAKRAGDRHLSYRPSALWDSSRELVLHVTKKVGLSSVYLPNEKFLRHFGPLNTQGYRLERSAPMSAARLDGLLQPEEIKAVDFLKVDVEGAAYEILKGAQKILKDGTVVGLRVEAEFNEKYLGQRLFSEVDGLLRQFDYELFDIRPCRWKRGAGLKTGGVSGQPVHGEFLYFLGTETFFEKIAVLPPEGRTAKTVKYVIFLCLYGIYDLALELVEEAFGREVLAEFVYALLKRELKKSQGILMRLPKLQGRGFWSEWAYYLFMWTGGVWLERAGYWKPEVEL